MHSPAMIIAVTKVQDLISEAEANRLAKQARLAQASRPSRIARVKAGFRSLLDVGAAAPTALPKLTNYPYRS